CAGGSCTAKSYETLNYDSGSLTCVTGASQHDDANYGCTPPITRGNVTSTTGYTDPVGMTGGITKNIPYHSVGNLRTANVDCCQQKSWAYSSATQYAYPDSETSGPSGGPQLTSSATYNAYTGVIATATDANSKTTTFTYDWMKR